MKLLNSLAFAFFLILFTFEPCSTFSQTDYLITDLESSDSSGFTNEANSWTYKSTLCPSCIFSMPSGSECSETVYGGPDASPTTGQQVFKRSYPISGTAWSRFGVEVEVWAFATAEWLNPTSVNMLGTQVTSSGGYTGSGFTLIGSCSTNYQSTSGSQINFIYKFRAQTVLSTSSLNTIDFLTQKSGGAPAFVDSIGLRNVKIYNMGSGSASSGVNFPCATSKFWDGTTCQSCVSTCSSCTGPNVGECTVCKTTAYNYGNGICLGTACSGAYQLVAGTKDCTKTCSTGFYFARGLSCVETCEEPLVQSVDPGGAPICSHPCTDATKFASPDGSCSSICDPLLEIDTTLKLCLNPCENSSDFVYPDGNCLDACPTPLSESTQKDVKYCESPCPSTAKFLNPDQSCSATCDPLLIDTTKNGIFSCGSPCQTTSDFVYPDGTCLNACPSPLLEKTQKGVKYCESPCTGLDKFLNPDQSCSAICDPLLKDTTKDGIFSCGSPCQTSSEFVYPDGNCLNTCPMPPLSQTTQKNVKYCENPCPSTAKFLFKDQSCSATCDTPLIDTTKNGIFSCSSPCEGTTKYLYPDGSCQDECPTPFSQKTENNIKRCYSTCSSPRNFLNPDGSCSLACDSYLTSITEHGIFSCKNICGGPTKYLYPDNSCKTGCPAPFPQKLVNGIQYCENPCFSQKTFLYEDGTCQKSCASPSIAKEYTSLGKACKFPCGNVDYYNNRNGKCTKTCEYTSKAIDSPLPKICYSTLTEEEVDQVKKIGDAANGANTATSTGSMIWSFLSSGDSTTAMLGPLAKMLQYIKFMDILFPEKVLILMDAQSKDTGFATKMMKNVLKEFPSHELPRKFRIYQSTSSFFVNLWPAIFNLSVILFVTGLVVFGVSQTKGRPKIHGILKNLMEVLKWNVFLITFCGSVGDIVLFTALEFQTMQFDNFAAVFSFLLCLGINTLTVLVVVQIIDVNSAIRRERKKAPDEEEQKKIIEQQWNSYKALFECYKDYSFYQQIFLFVFLVRVALFNAIIGYFYNYPLFQATTAVASNILMLGYLLIKKPMKKVVNLIQQIVLEFVLLPFNVCVLALAIMDYHEIDDTARRRSIGDVIVYINLIAPILSGALLAAKAIVMGVDFYRTWKLAKANKLKKLGSIQTSSPIDSLSGSKNFATADQTQILDISDPSLILMEQSSVRSSIPLDRNQRIRPVRSKFMPSNYDNDTNLLQIPTNQNLIVQENQSETQGLKNQRWKINKRRNLVGTPLKIKFGN